MLIVLALLWFPKWAQCCPMLLSEMGNSGESDSYEMKRDPESGCLCRVYETQNYVTCYDTQECVSYPRHIEITKRTLRLTTTHIEVLNEGDLMRHTMLETFQMDMNDNFYRISPGAFFNMSNLINVSISYNKNLQYLEAEAFRGLTNVKYLKLDKNGFHVLKDFSYSINSITLPRLHTLMIAQMPFPDMVHDDFVMNGTNLKIFILRTCQITKIEPRALSGFKGLQVLDLTENNLDLDNLVDILKMTIENGIDLRELHLSEMGFKEIPVKVLNVVSKTNISSLKLSNNHFEIIGKFPWMPNVISLELTRVLALNITPGAFDLLPNLKELHLNKNKFSEVPKAVLLNTLKYLDISYSDNYFSLEDSSLVNLTDLHYLNLSGNNIRKINRETFNGLGNLRVLALKDSKIFYVGSESFSTLENLTTLDLRLNLFVSRGLQRDVFKGLYNLENLLLGDCKITNLTEPKDLFRDLVKLRYLGLENNNLKNLEKSVLTPLRDLVCLDISSNEFVSWYVPMFSRTHKLKNFIAFENTIKYITSAMVEDFSQLHELNLYNNPFICRCSDMITLSKMCNEKLTRLLDNHHIACSYPENWTNHTLVDLLKRSQELCQQEDVIKYIPLILFAILSMSLIIFLGYKHKQLKYWYFLAKLHLQTHPRKSSSSPCGVPDYQYDAFVSYSNEDQNFVIYLVKMLELDEPFLKLCVYERDFEIGTVISETVLESVAKSRKTLLIVSESYIKSQWCRWEVQVAENKRLFWEDGREHNRDSLIIIKFRNVSVKHLSPMLKYLMRTRIYLEWDDEDVKKQAVFWRKLRRALQKPE